MGVEIPAEKVPHIQKMIIRKCNLACKGRYHGDPDARFNDPQPASDACRGIGWRMQCTREPDAVMLSGETAMGSYPIEAVRMMSQIAEESEKYLDYMFYQRRKVSAENLRNISNTVALFIRSDRLRSGSAGHCGSGVSADLRRECFRNGVRKH